MSGLPGGRGHELTARSQAARHPECVSVSRTRLLHLLAIGSGRPSCINPVARFLSPEQRIYVTRRRPRIAELDRLGLTMCWQPGLEPWVGGIAHEHRGATCGRSLGEP